jgi:hypothetical protein
MCGPGTLRVRRDETGDNLAEGARSCGQALPLLRRLRSKLAPCISGGLASAYRRTLLLERTGIAQALSQVGGQKWRP